MEVRELKYSLLGLGEEGISIMSLAENARDERGDQQVCLDRHYLRYMDKSRGAEVADVARCAGAARTDIVSDANNAWICRDEQGDPGGSVGTLEACVLCPTDVAGIVDDPVKKTCDQAGRRKLVFIEQMKDIWWQTKRTTRNFRNIIEHIKMRQAGILATAQRKQRMMSRVPEYFQDELLQEVRVLDDRISAEETRVV